MSDIRPSPAVDGRPEHYLPKPGERALIRPPKFADKFAKLDFNSPLMPMIALFPVP